MSLKIFGQVYDQICTLYIESSKIIAAGSLLNITSPNDFPTAGNDYYMDLGEILCQAGQKMEKVTGEIEKKAMRDFCPDKAALDKK